MNASNILQRVEQTEVEWKTVAEIFDIKNGYTPSKSNQEYWENGSIPWFRMEDIRENGQILHDALQKVSESAVKSSKLFPANSIIMATSATIGEHALVTVSYLANQRFTNLSLKSEFQERFEMKFLFCYCFLLADWCKKNTTMSSFASVDMVGFRKFEIPIPPISLQKEIVNILDKLTELKATLKAELSLREKQYRYYRDYLLTFGDDVEWKHLGEVCHNIFSGKNKNRCVDGIYPIYGSTGIIGRTNNFMFAEDRILVARVGANAGFVHIAMGKYDVSDNTLIVENMDSISMKYLYYYLENMNLNQFTKGAGQPLITGGQLKALKIPIPPLETQAKIVAILDKFETLTRSITEGLPKEIELRDKQYQYYRDKLLNFNKKKM